MLVRKSSWHYKMVQHKMTFKTENIRENNTLLLDYLHEVWMGFYCYLLTLPIVATSVAIYHAPEVFRSHPVLLYGYIVILSSPLWLAIVFGITGLLMKKVGRRLSLRNKKI